MVLEKERKKIHEGLFGRKGFMNVMSSKVNRKKTKIKGSMLVGKQKDDKELLINAFKARAGGEEPCDLAPEDCAAERFLPGSKVESLKSK